MKIVINNHQFTYDIGCRILKTKYSECPFENLQDIWNDIQPMTFSDIAQHIDNIEQRRVAIECLGIDRLTKEINPTLVSKQTIKKQTPWIDKDGKLVNKKFSDTYELYKVKGEDLAKGIQHQALRDAYYVKCVDTSTDREYLIWVEPSSVFRTNNDRGWWQSGDDIKINAIQCVAWTIQTDVPIGNIEKIIRQGDCILIKPIDTKIKNGSLRHLTEVEYRELLVAES